MGKNFAIQTWLLAAQQSGEVTFRENICVWDANDEWEISMTDDGDFTIGKNGESEKVEKLSAMLDKIYG